ncbi:Csu type fimbrial protein [Aquisediminimonas profunda]|uniref:Csu type fimbrial protein n=1 Tax=Aquisediminimonas profunda TaxID=1550733 RepID=UPI001C635845|nr:spore coat U domain-containing protein [Aquisediminimonas profunda]
MRNLLIVGAVGLFGMTSQAFAGTASGTLDVTMTVANNCTLASGGGKEPNNLAGGSAGSNGVLDFGNQDSGINRSPIDGSTAGGFGADIVLNCTGSTLSPQISFDAGANALGNQRRLASTTADSTSFVEYNIYIDSGRANPLLPNQFYDLVPDALPSGLNGGRNDIQVYGRVAEGQDLKEGTYGDSLRLQVNY